MKLLDTSHDSHLTGIVDLLGTLGHVADPRDLLEGLTADLRGGRTRAYGEVTTTGPEREHFAVRRLRGHDGADLLATPPVEPTGFGGGLLAELIRTPVPKIIHDIDLSSDPILPSEMKPYRSVMAVPLFVEETARDWAILFATEPDAFSSDELADLMIRTNLVGISIANLRITRRLFEANLKIRKEIEDIAAIQRSLLPETLPDIPGLQIAASYETCSSAGGDLYDFVPLGLRPGHQANPAELRWAILIGDVSWHGPAAAVVMAMLHSILHAYPEPPNGPGEVLAHVNRHLCAKQLGGTFTTAFLAFYDPATRTLSYALAGHGAPLLVSPAGHSYLDAVRDLPLGVDPDAKYAEASLQLHPGEIGRASCRGRV